MISKKQKRRTVLLVILLAIVIVAGVFAISYKMNGYKAPWVASAPIEEVEEKQEEVKEPVPEIKPEPKEEAKEPEPEEVQSEPELLALTDKFGYYGALKVNGTKLCDSKGEEVQLIGVSSHGLSWFPEYVSADSIKYLKENFGINTVRLAMYTSDYNGYCVGGSEIQAALKDTIDEAVKAATDNDMYVIIDWHILNDSNPNEYKGEAIQFFGEIVRKYKTNENVIYEICNEPNGDTKWEDIKAYANEVIPVIRGIDKDALILVGTPNYCQDLEPVIDAPLEFDNIMYTFHFYSSTHKTKFRNKLINAIDNGIPVFISEFGFVEASGDGKIDDKEAMSWIEVIDEYKLSACAWNLSNKDEGSALISSDCDKITDWTYDDLSEQGQFIYDYFKENSDDN